MWARGSAASRPHIDDRVARVDAALQEVHWRIADQRERRAAVGTRASILVASTAITVSLLDLGADEFWILAATVFTIAAAGLGVYALFPGKSWYPSVRQTTHTLLEHPLQDARSEVIEQKIAYYEGVAGRFHRQSLAVRWGYVALGIGITASAVAAVIGVVA